MSTVTGAGIVAWEALTTHTVTVTAKDETGVDRGVGGDTFSIQISNQCTNTADFKCDEDAGAEQTIPSQIVTTMTDIGDGTYTYSYQVLNDGVLTVSVILESKETILVDYYSNIDFTGTHEQFYESIIDFDFGYSAVFGRELDNLSVIFTAYLLPPVTGTYTFVLQSDNGSDLIIDGVRLCLVLLLLLLKAIRKQI